MGWVFVAAAAITSALLEEWIRLETQNHPVRVAVVGGVALVIAALVLFVASIRTATIAAAFVFGAWAIGLIQGLDDRDHTLGYYCRYGADSQRELEGCMRRVNTDAIDRLDTPAARFARGETSVCGPGSGRFCAAAARESS